MSDLEIIEFKDPEQNRLAEECYYEFQDWLNAQRRTAENKVRALYPRLANGVSVQAIQAATDESRRWYAVPDDLAGCFAYDMVTDWGKRGKIHAAALDMHICEWWLENHWEYEEDS